MTAEPKPLLVRMRGITKDFAGVPVLQGVDLDIRGGEVLVLAGENGAGKSTLIKILGGVHTGFAGTIEIEGRPVQPRSPLEAARLGVSVIFQELSLVPPMTVADNIFLERPPTRFGLVNHRVQQMGAQKLLDRLGIQIDVLRRIEDLPIAQQQLVEIAKALAREAKVIVMDEPTSALNAPEVEKLFGLIADLKERGCGIVYITHKMEEIERIADRITVLRDGRHVGTAPASELPPRRLVEWMVGRELDAQFPSRERGRSARCNVPEGETADDCVTQRAIGNCSAREESAPGERLRVEEFSVVPERASGAPLVDRVSFCVRAREIVGVAGLQGSGNSDMFLGLFGAHGRRTTGRVWLNGKPLRISTPRTAIGQGVAMLTNDRKATGLVLPLSIIANTTLADLERLCMAGWRQPKRERAVTERLAGRLSLAATSLDQEVGWLSGGNQQKVALAKWLQTEPELLLLDEPTRGIDVGAKREIYRLLEELTGQGIAILLITSELPELLALSDRIIVMHRGRMTGEFSRAEATPEMIMEAAMGISR